jgi:GT2 family glycosyltransferase/glycosyltransferase involved in cell wall biosynthesis
VPTCSIIVPVHNRASLTRQCLNTLLANTSGTASTEIIVVDDASTDLTPALLRCYGDRITVITLAKNSGIATACNIGAAEAAGDYLVFLSNDTIPHIGWLDALLRYSSLFPAATMIGSKLIYPNGTIQHAGVVVCQDRYPRHIYAGFPGDHPAVNRSRRFQIVSGACVLVGRAPFSEVGGFDPSFTNGYEDVDLCLRLGERGHEIHFCHDSILCHLESLSRGIVPTPARQNKSLYDRRWRDHVRPDDVQYYMEDGLMNIRYSRHYPFELELSPLLGTIRTHQRDSDLDRLLAARAWQVSDLVRENVSLLVKIQEAELQAAINRPDVPTSAPIGPSGVDQWGGRRVLVVDDRVPVSSLGLGFPRTRAMLDTLVGLGYRVTYLPLVDRAPNEPTSSELRELGVEVLHHIGKERALLQAHAGRYDVAIVSRPHNAPILDLIRKFNPNAGLVYDAEALFALRDIALARHLGAPMSRDEAEARIQFEFALMDKADLVITVSETERQVVQAHRPDLPVVVWGYPVRPRMTGAGFADRRDLLFVGNLSTRVNVDAVRWFLKKVFPDVRAALSCQLHIAGGGAREELRTAVAKTSGAAVLLGRVDDLAPIYDRSRVFIAPHRVAGGIPLKVLEAMAYGIPSVVSTLLAEQLGISDGNEAMIATNARTFSDSVIRLYEDSDLWQHVQHRACGYIERHNDPDALQAALQDGIEMVCAGRSAPDAGPRRRKKKERGGA